MARYTIRYWMEAAEELEEATDWYLAASPEAAENWRLAVRRTLESIRSSPTMWAADRSGIRSVLIKSYPYQLIYHVSGNVIEVYAVAHTSRRPGYWRNRLKRR